MSNDVKSATNDSDGDIQWDENSDEQERDNENGTLYSHLIYSRLVIAKLYPYN